MPRNKTTSPLAKKYGQKKVVRARNLLQSRMGLTPGSKSAGKKIPWGVVGKIVQDEEKSGKTIKKSDMKDATKDYKRHGLSRSGKKYLKESKKKTKLEKSRKIKNVSRVTSKKRK